jgi:hypothetical protein
VTYGFSHEGIDQGLKFAREEFCINKIWGFRSFAMERLIKDHGTGSDKFPFCFKVPKFQHNNRNLDQFDVVMHQVKKWFRVDFILQRNFLSYEMWQS